MRLRASTDHISPWSATAALFAGAKWCCLPAPRSICTGPTAWAASTLRLDAAFIDDAAGAEPRMGVRDLEDA